MPTGWKGSRVTIAELTQDDERGASGGRRYIGSDVYTETRKRIAWVETWRQRCYRDLIPDDLPDGLLFTGRAPSWKAIAICLLNNDFRLHKLGYTTTPGEWAQAALDIAERAKAAAEVEQLSLFDEVSA